MDLNIALQFKENRLVDLNIVYFNRRLKKAKVESIMASAKIEANFDEEQSESKEAPLEYCC